MKLKPIPITNISLIYFLSIIIFISYLTLTSISISCSQIHILRRIQNQNYTPNSTSNSKFTELCKAVTQTFNYLGKDSLNLYKLCDGKYNLLGKDSKPIMEKKPFCFTGLSNFLCKNKIINRDDAKKGNSKCKNEDLIKLVLTTIRGCFNEVCYWN